MKKNFEYSDELKDDFGTTRNTFTPLPEDYDYKDGNIFFRALSFFLYRFVARPLAFLYVKIKFSHKFVNKSLLKDIKIGYLIYSNHVTLLADALIPNLLSVKKRNYILTGKDASSLTGILWLMKCVGNIPLGQTRLQSLKMMRQIKKKLNGGSSITVYPEAHAWPYYTGIRPYDEQSFYYSASASAPVVALTTCFSARRFFKTPKITTFVDGPFYPDPSLSNSENARMLRDKVYSAMCDRAARYSTYSYYNYVRKEEANVRLEEDAGSKECVTK